MKDGKMILLRVPYPLGFYAKGFDGRIDDPKAGWKGRGLWSSSGDRAPWLNGERQRLQAARRALPDSPRSAGEVIHYDPAEPLVAVPPEWFFTSLPPRSSNSDRQSVQAPAEAF